MLGGVMEIPKGLKYSKEHEWVAVEDTVATIGITDHAQEQLGEIVYIELPAVGDKISKDDPFGVVESAAKHAVPLIPHHGQERVRIPTNVGAGLSGSAILAKALLRDVAPVVVINLDQGLLDVRRQPGRQRI